MITFVFPMNLKLLYIFVNCYDCGAYLNKYENFNNYLNYESHGTRNVLSLIGTSFARILSLENGKTVEHYNRDK